MTPEQQSEAISRIDANVTMLLSEHARCREEITDHAARIAVVEDSSKSAHHRVTELKRDMMWTIVEMTAIATIVCNIITWGLSKVLH